MTQRSRVYSDKECDDHIIRQVTGLSMTTAQASRMEPHIQKSAAVNGMNVEGNLVHG